MKKKPVKPQQMWMWRNKRAGLLAPGFGISYQRKYLKIAKPLEGIYKPVAVWVIVAKDLREAMGQ